MLTWEAGEPGKKVSWIGTDGKRKSWKRRTRIRFLLLLRRRNIDENESADDRPKKIRASVETKAPAQRRFHRPPM